MIRYGLAEILKFTPALASGWLLAFTLSLDDLILTQTDEGFDAARPGSSPAAYKLNNSGVLLFALANGRYSLAEIVSLVAETFGMAIPPEAEVRSFYLLAARAGLVPMFSRAAMEASVMPQE